MLFPRRFGRLFSDQVDVATEGFDAIIPSMLSGLPDALIGLVVLLVLSASMSTLSSLVIASSSTLTLDFLKDNFVKNMSDKTQVLIIRVLIILFIAISVIIAIIQYRSNITFIAQLMGISWGRTGRIVPRSAPLRTVLEKDDESRMLVQLRMGYGHHDPQYGGQRYIPSDAQSSINAGAFAMLGSMIIVPVVSMLTPKLDDTLVSDCFACYERKVEVSAKLSLGDDETGLEEGSHIS